MSCSVTKCLPTEKLNLSVVRRKVLHANAVALDAPVRLDSEQFIIFRYLTTYFRDFATLPLKLRAGLIVQ